MTTLKWTEIASEADFPDHGEQCLIATAPTLTIAPEVALARFYEAGSAGLDGEVWDWPRFEFLYVDEYYKSNGLRAVVRCDVSNADIPDRILTRVSWTHFKVPEPTGAFDKARAALRVFAVTHPFSRRGVYFNPQGESEGLFNARGIPHLVWTVHRMREDGSHEREPLEWPAEVYSTPSMSEEEIYSKWASLEWPAD